MIAPHQVDLREHPHSGKLGREILNEALGIDQGRLPHSGAYSLHKAAQPPDVFGTIWSGEAHGLDDLRMMPMASILSNSDLAALNLSGGRRRARACTG